MDHTKPEGDILIFNSKLFLSFKNRIIEDKFRVYLLNCFRSNKIKLITIYLFLIVLSIVNLTLIIKFTESFSFYSWTIIMMVILKILCIFYNFCQTMIRSDSKKLNLEHIITGVNFFFIGIHFHLFMNLFHNSKQQNPIVLIITLLYLVQMAYIYLYIKSFITIIIVCSLMIVFISLLYNSILLSVPGNFYTVSYSLFLICCSIIAYINEFRLRVNFFLIHQLKLQDNSINNHEKQIRNSFKKILDSFKSSYVSINQLGDLTYMNKSMKNLINIIENNTEFKCEETLKFRIDTESTINLLNNEPHVLKKDNDLNLDYLNIFKCNQIKFPFRNNKIYNNSKYINKNKKVDLSTPTMIIEFILNNLTYVNEEMVDRDIFNYLNKIKLNNTNNSVYKQIQKNSRTFHNLFDFKTFFNIVKSINTREFILDRSKNEEIQKHNNDRNNLLKPSNLNTNSAVLLFNTELSCLKENISLINSNNDKKSSNSPLRKWTTFKEKEGLKRTTYMSKRNEYLFLGRTRIKLIKKENTNIIFNNNNENRIAYREYCIYYRFIYNTSENEHQIEFIIDDQSFILNNERKETAITCRSLYLSKISHEFKNPVCNLMEIISFLSDDINNLKIKNKMMWGKEPISYKGDSSNSSSFSESDEIQVLNKKSSSNTICSNLDQNINMLKNVCEMLLLLLNDFTFYSSLLEEDEEENPLNSLNQDTSVINTNMKYQKIGSPKKRTRKSDANSENLKLTLGRMNKLGTGINNIKICNYKDIINELCNIFKIKSKIDGKKSKLTFQIRIDKFIPDTIECDQEIFKSLFFNLLYQVYKTTFSGKITISVNTNNTQQNKKLQFEISSSGVVYSNVKGMVHDENIIEENSILSSPHLNSQKCPSIRIVEIDSKNCENFTELLNNQDTQKNLISKLCNKESPLKDFTENFHIKNLLSISDPLERNSIIDEFNNNFHIYISHIYSKKIGCKLLIENNKKGEIRISFQIETNYNNSINSNTNFTIINNQNSEATHKNHSDKTSIINLIGMDSNVQNSNLIDKSNQKNNSNKFLSPELKLNTGRNIYDSIRDFPFNGSLNRHPTPKIKPLVRESRFSPKGIKNILNCSMKGSSPPTERTISNKGEMCFNYSYFMGMSKTIKDICMINNHTTNNSHISYSDKDIIINRGNIIINHFNSKQTSKYNSTPHSNSVSQKSNSHLNILPKNCFSRTSKGLPNKDSLIYKKNSSYRKSSFYVNVLNSRKSLNYSSVNISRLNIDKITSNSDDNEFRILLCDDESLIRKTLIRFFNLISKDFPKIVFDVQSVENGFECLNMIYKYHKEGKCFDLLIIDETMPIIKGSQIIYLMKSLIKEKYFEHLIIVSFTAYNSSSKTDYIYSQGADYVLHKPIKYDEFKSFFIDEIFGDENNLNNCNT